MIKNAKMNLQFFAEEAAAVPATAETGTPAAEPTTGENFMAGDQLADGTQVKDAQVAAALNRQMKRHPELRDVYRQGRKQAPAAPEAAGDASQPDGEPTLEQRWQELRKGEFKDMIAQDIQNAIKERFKNQEDANQKLTSMQPMLDALMKKAGVESVDELQKIVLDDDSLYEEEAEKAGMPVEAYKTFKQIQDERNALKAQQEQSMQEQMFRQHIASLIQQAEKLRQTFPNFDLKAELQNDQFRRLTSPEVGLSVEDAYFAMHRNELAPQLMGLGMQKAREQMSQTIQARQARPAEGAAGKSQQAADMRIDPRAMTREERDRIRRQVHSGKVVSFD